MILMEPSERVQESVTLIFLATWAAWKGFDLAIFIITNFFLIRSIVREYSNEKAKPKDIHYYWLVLLGVAMIAVSEFIWIRYFIAEF